MISIQLLLLVLAALMLILFAVVVRHLVQVKVWICTKKKDNQPLKKIAYLKRGDEGTASEVHRTSAFGRPPIALVRADEQAAHNRGYVEALTDDTVEDGEKAQYRRIGFVCFEEEGSSDRMAYVYKQIQGKKNKEIVGYLAAPSDPHTPTIHGERSWKTLWLCCTLNAFAGSPEAEKKKPVAVCSYWGFHSSKKDLLPAEARAGAFSLLQRFAPKQTRTETSSAQPYGWKDTALLSSIIYTVLFLIMYVFNTGVFQLPLLGRSWGGTSIFVSYYFVLWAIVRFIKIDAIENAYSFQPMLDLLNKNLGMKIMNTVILVLCSTAMVFTGIYYDYDFMPLLIVITTGISTNMSLAAANQRWKIQSSFLEENNSDEDEEQTEPQNPDGDISRTYAWKMDDTYPVHHDVTGELTLYFRASDIKDVRHLNPFFSQRKEYSDKETILSMFRFLKRYRKTFLARTNYVAYTINKIAEKYQFEPLDKLQFTLDFVQEPNIVFQKNSENKTINFYDDYIRFPDETLYDKCGDSNSKSLLAAMLFHLMGHNVLYLLSRKHQHAAIGVEVTPRELEEGVYGNIDSLDNIIIRYEERYYIFCETTGDSFCLGARKDGMELDDFEQKILLPLHDPEDDWDRVRDEDPSAVEGRIYTWELTSLEGKTLQGNVPLEFSVGSINELRRTNPFATYGEDSHTYIENVATIFNYLKEDPERTSAIRQLTDYIRTLAKEAGLSELDTVQFALNFAQAPNIIYMLDEKSAPIEYAKEYMRFPDEVLFDKEGDCDCKSSLTAALFLALGYKVIFMLSQKYKHAAIGLECKNENWLTQVPTKQTDAILREYNGSKYLYCETTGNGFHIGEIPEGETIQEFETVLELAI